MSREYTVRRRSFRRKIPEPCPRVDRPPSGTARKLRQQAKNNGDSFVPDVEVITEDTHETISVPGLLAGDFCDHGYEWLEALELTRWVGVPFWGVDCWEASDWSSQYLVAATQEDDKGSTTFYGFGLWIEYQTEIHWFRSRLACCEAITGALFNFWKLGIVDGPDPADLPATAAELPSQYREPSGGEWFPQRSVTKK